MNTQGRRIPDEEWFQWQADGRIEPGDFGKVDGEWLVKSPDGVVFQLASERSPDASGRHHEVEEHEDGMISVEPRTNNSNSILSPRGWHGWIRRGVWA